MINELFERELQNTSINGVSLADYIKDNYIAKDQGKWIPVKTSLPEDAEDVLVTDGSDVFIAWHTADKWCSHSDLFNPYSYPIIAWMPLPEPYRTEQEPTDWHGKYSDDEQAYKAFAKEYINRSQTESEDKNGKLKEM